MRGCRRFDSRLFFFFLGAIASVRTLVYWRMRVGTLSTQHIETPNIKRNAIKIDWTIFILFLKSRRFSAVDIMIGWSTFIIN